MAGAVCGSIALWLFTIERSGHAPSTTNLPLPLQVITVNDAPAPAVPPAAVAQSTPLVMPENTLQTLTLPQLIDTTTPDPVATPTQATRPAAALPLQQELSLLIPVSGVTAAQLRNTFTDARSQGRSHDAIDIMADTGTPVFAVADGTLVKFFDSNQGGHTIYQFDPLGKFAFYYAHLDRRAANLSEGQSVKRGEVIGYVGYSGNANPAGPHLHFAIFMLGPEKTWWRGTAINPYGYLGGL